MIFTREFSKTKSERPKANGQTHISMNNSAIDKPWLPGSSGLVAYAGAVLALKTGWAL